MSPTQRRNSNQNEVTCASNAVTLDDTGPWNCCSPKGCIYNNGSNAEHIMITKEDLKADDQDQAVVKMACSNENCDKCSYMHTACFQAFEESVLTFLKGQGRAKGWSDKQKLQNLWTKRGYDLVYKACECLCGHGHIKKDLDWFHERQDHLEVQEVQGAASAALPTTAGRKRKKSKSSGAKPTTITIGLPTFSQTGNVKRSDAQNVPSSRNRTNSVSSITSGSSFGSSSGDVGSCGHSHSSNEGIHPPRRAALLQDRSRHDSGGSIFVRRMDYSSFNVLPKQKVNSYHIKMEDECSIGNDETRIFILSNLASNKLNKVPCVLCNAILTVFDRYPLIDGTFFLSPRQHNRTCIKVKLDGKSSFLTPVCMGCLEGWTAHIVCKFCFKPWTGGHLILGTMYSYDIFAAVPCCPERLKCNNCGQLVIHPDQRFSFFSDYSQIVSCPHCGVQEAHFSKNLPAIFMRRDADNLARQMRVTRVNSA